MQPSVNMVVQNDIFRLNACSDARYGVFGWLQQEHSGNVDSSLMDFRFTFFYVDRLTEDKSNQIEVQSVGIETLDNIIRKLYELEICAEGDYTIRPFNQRFLDECAGAFVNVTLSVPVSGLCSTSFADFISEDFNDDFLIY